MTATTRRHLGQAAEVLVVAVTVLSLTLGPVYQARQRWPRTVDLAVDPVVVTFLMAVHVLPMAYVAARWARVGTRLSWLGAGCATVLCGLLVLSTFWSYTPSTTARVSLQVAVTVVSGVYLVGAVDARTRLYGMVAGLHVGLLWSAWRIYRSKAGSLDEAGNWVGAYFNRNSLAPVAVLGGIGCAFLLLGAREAVTARAGQMALAVVAVGLAVLDVRLFIGTGSRTSGVAFLIAVATVGVLLLARRSLGHLSTSRLQALVGGGLVVVAAAGFALRSVLLSPFASPGDLTGRTDIWGVVVDWWAKRPLQGWGYLALWGQNPELSTDLYAQNDGIAASSAHSSFFDVLLGGGILAGLALIGLVVAGWIVVSGAVLRSRSVLVLLPAVTWVYCLVLHSVETFLIGNMLFWALLVGGIVTPADTGDRSVRGDGADDRA